MLYAILYLENSDKDRFSDLNNRVENNCVLNNLDYPSTVNSVQSLLLNYQPNYNFNSQSQYNGIRNQLMFTQRGKTGSDDCETKYKENKPQRNLDHITCNKCGENYTMRVTMSDIYRKNSERVQKHSRK